MHKGNTGYLLLFILVVTGLAGRYSTDTLTAKERSFLEDRLKVSQKNFLKSVQGLSEAQINFKPSASQWSIKECIYHIALSEVHLRKKAEAVLKAKANPEIRNEIQMSDIHIIKNLSAQINKNDEDCLRPVKTIGKTTYEIIQSYKHNSNSLIKYTQTTTENLRNHVGYTQFGATDAYQMLLMLSAHTRLHTKQIKEIKANSAFPKE